MSLPWQSGGHGLKISNLVSVLPSPVNIDRKFFLINQDEYCN